MEKKYRIELTSFEAQALEELLCAYLYQTTQPNFETTVSASNDVIKDIREKLAIVFTE